MHTPPRTLVVLAAALALVTSVLPLGLLPPLDQQSGAARAAILEQYASQGQLPVAPGVTHDWGTIATGSGQQVVNVVQVQPGAPGITFEAALSNDEAVGLERPSTEANRKSYEGHRAIAAINGDVWSGSSVGANAAPFGLDIQNGELEIAGNAARPTFGIDANGQPLIGAPVVTTNLITADGVIHPINRINQHRNAGDYVLYTPRFGPQTDVEGSGVEVVLTGVPLPLQTSVNAMATVVQVRTAGNQPIDPGDLVVSGPAGTFLSSLVPGSTIQLTISITAGWETATQAIGGREFLLRNGATYIYPHPSIADQYHPRTAIGVTANGGVVLAVVDGRDAGYSTGVTDEELASVMAEQGAVNAINLDGGGSTAMSVRQPGDDVVSIVNRPSDGSERPVANSLLVFSAAPTGPLAMLAVRPTDQTIYTQSSVAYGVAGQDAADNPVAAPAGVVTWSAQGLTGTFDSSGRFTATATGTGTITATSSGIQGSTRLTVLADTTPPVSGPPLLSLVRGDILGSTVPIQVSWPAATDVGVGVASYELQANVNGGGWKTVNSGTALNRYIRIADARGANYRYADRARDGAGNVGSFATAPSVRVVVLSEASKSIVFKGGWTRITSPSYDGHAAMSTRTPGGSATYTFVGSSFAWVSALSPVRGSADVYVDGVLRATLSLFSKATIARQMVFTKTWTSSGRHTIRIVALGTAGHPRVDVDAFIVLAPPTIGVFPPPTPTPT
ncbi:MAG TPA: phosphodiester glycosidase family protein, partial [Candidatus Saccharimonadales bacterium]|nr:phosphodiester glycosidase family protein [Candidatus Saccharimonadales bacterium]